MDIAPHGPRFPWPRGTPVRRRGGPAPFRGGVCLIRSPLHRNGSRTAVIRHEDIGRAVREAEYAVRGPIVARAQELERQGRKIIYCNIGNPQSLGQRPLTWVRQVLALAEYPELLERAPKVFPADVLEAARRVLAGSQHGLGAYTESKGLRFVREAVAEFIHARDGIASDPEAIFLTDGASKGVQSV